MGSVAYIGFYPNMEVLYRISSNEVSVGTLLVIRSCFVPQL